MRLLGALLSLLAATASVVSAAPFWGGYPSNIHIFPPPGAVVVAQESFIPGAYRNVTAGVNALPVNETGEQYLFIYPGVYKEQVYIPARKANLTIYGWTLDSSSYHANTVNITYDLALINTTSDDLTATVRVWVTNFKMYNLNILNTFGHINSNGQNLAVSAHNPNQGYYGCGLYSYQDTLYAQTGAQLYAHSLIVGAIDFIFGKNALAWFHKCDIRTIAAGCVTASGRTAANDSSWYVLNKADVRGINETFDAEKQNYLGRPWEPFARVVFQESYLGQCIEPAGWSIWDPGDDRTSNVTFAEYQNYGPGSILEEGPRANFSVQFKSPVSVESILGNGYQDEWWVDDRYLDP